jgi:hypothetical protein
MPEAGVRRFLNSVGKGEATRLEQEIFDEVEEVSAQKRMPSGSQEIHARDVALLARYFGVSYEAALYHLLNLKRVPKVRHTVLLHQKESLRPPPLQLLSDDREETVSLTVDQQLLLLGLEALNRGEISRGRLRELAAEVGIADRVLDELLDRVGYSGAVEALLPE